jgi:hypothetical protein
VLLQSTDSTQNLKIRVGILRNVSSTLCIDNALCSRYIEFYFILAVKIYTVDREERVSGETSVTICIAVRGIQREKMI